MDVHKLKNQEFRRTAVPTEPLEVLLAAVSARTPKPTLLKQKVDGIRIFDVTYGPFEVEYTRKQAVISPVGPVNIEVGVPLEISMRAVEGDHWTTARYNGQRPAQADEVVLDNAR